MRDLSHPPSQVVRVWWWFPPMLTLLPLVLLLTACGDSSTMVGAVTLSRHSHIITADATNRGVSTVACAADEHLVSGGFAQFGDLSQANASSELLGGSFPSDATGQPSTAPTAWTVASADFPGETVTAFVNCVKTTQPVQVTAVVNEQVYTANGPYTQVASCPAGTVRTGGGMRGDTSPIEAAAVSAQSGAMYPTGTQDWTVKGAVDMSPKTPSPVTVDVYAVCVTTAAFAPAPLASTTVTIPPQQQVPPTTACPTPPTVPSDCASDLRVNGSAACPAGQLLTGGGYSDVVVSGAPGLAVGLTFALIYGDTAQGDEASWLVQFHAYAYHLPGQPGGQGTATLWAVCVTPS